MPLEALPVEQQPDLTFDERRGLCRTHDRADVRYIDGEVIRLAQPECVECGEPWGYWGCRTTRAVLLLGIRETDLKAEKRRVDELTEALTPRFGVHRLQDPANQAVELKMRIDRYTLTQGGMGVVYATLEKMGAEFKAWFKKIGDKRRLADDYLYATEIDNDYYVYLTQEFDPSAPFLKRPGAPWDTP